RACSAKKGCLCWRCRLMIYFDADVLFCCEEHLPQPLRVLSALIDAKMDLARELVDAMFAMHGIRGPWAPMPATGVVNRIYATHDVVLRVGTHHPESISDARTESVAAPVAHAADILTPRLIAFDDSRTLVDRPFSLWERVYGTPLGLLELSPGQRADAWRQVGRELCRLHQRITACPDPNSYLDTPGRDTDLY